MKVRNDMLKMGREGVEPSRCYQRQILSLLRLPIPPSPRQLLLYSTLISSRLELLRIHCYNVDYVYNKGIPFVFCGHWIIVVVCNDSMFKFANYN